MVNESIKNGTGIRSDFVAIPNQNLDITKNVNYNNPSSILSNAQSIADYNTNRSQDLAREQMEYQTQANALAMDYNATEAQKTRDWQKLMSDTAHQREVKDLIAAGLNPILSANQGASTGTAGSAQGVTSSGAKGNVDMSTVESLTNVYKTLAEIEMQQKYLNMTDKQINAQVAMNELSNATNRYMSDQSVAASMYNAGLTSSAQRYAAGVPAGATQYAAQMNSDAQRYAADLSYRQWEEGLHSPINQTVRGVSEAASDAVDSAAGILNKILGGRTLFDNSGKSGAQSYENPNYKRPSKADWQ